MRKDYIVSYCIVDNIIDIVSLGLNNNTNQRDPCSLCNNRVKCNQYTIKCTNVINWFISNVMVPPKRIMKIQ